LELTPDSFKMSGRSGQSSQEILQSSSRPGADAANQSYLE